MPYSFDTLLDRYQAIQQVLLVTLQDKKFIDVVDFWGDSSASYYNKRTGRRPFTYKDVKSLLTGLNMTEELAVVNLLGQCRQHLWEILQTSTPGKIKALPLSDDIINRLLLLQARKVENWEPEDIQLILSALGHLYEQIEYVLDLPANLIKQASSPTSEES